MITTNNVHVHHCKNRFQENDAKINCQTSQSLCDDSGDLYKYFFHLGQHLAFMREYAIQPAESFNLQGNMHKQAIGDYIILLKTKSFISGSDFFLKKGGFRNQSRPRNCPSFQ